MQKVLILTAAILLAPLQVAVAQTISPSPVAHKPCENAMVCATMHDGRSVAVTDCAARHTGAVRYLYGDCYDED